MASNAIVSDLRTSLERSRNQLAARVQALGGEAQARIGTAGADVQSSLDLLRQVFNANLAESEGARLDIENLNTLLAKQVGAAPVGFSRFTNPQKASKFQARSAPSFGRRQASVASSGTRTLASRFGR